MLQSLCYGTKLTLSEAAKRLECYRGLLYADPQPSPLEPPGDLSQLSEFHVSMSDFGKHVQFWFFGIRNLSFKRTEINDAFIALILQSFTMDMQILPYVWFYNHIVDHRDRHPSRKAERPHKSTEGSVQKRMPCLQSQLWVSNQSGSSVSSFKRWATKLRVKHWRV